MQSGKIRMANPAKSGQPGSVTKKTTNAPICQVDGPMPPSRTPATQTHARQENARAPPESASAGKTFVCH